MDQKTLERYADLAVRSGANVQPDQIVVVQCKPGEEYLARAIAASAFRHGARFVDIDWFDPWVKRARLEYAREDTLAFVPSWYGERELEYGRQRCAVISLHGLVAADLFSDLDPARVALDRLPGVKEAMITLNERTVNWTVIPCPTVGWAQQVFPGLGPNNALEHLEELLFHVLRLDTPDPHAAWEKRMLTLNTVAQRLTNHRFDAINYKGPGTDLTVGLLASSKWHAADSTTVDGIRHVPNLPSEEVFTSPDPLRAHGYVQATKPLVLNSTVINNLRVEFENGQAKAVSADSGEEVMRATVKSNANVSRLGEVALVDSGGRIGKLDTVFYSTLLDENAASHIALGDGIEFLVEGGDKDRINQCDLHIDFMIGSNDVEVTGITTTGERIPILRGGVWQI